jgi:hypothetical protein
LNTQETGPFDRTFWNLKKPTVVWRKKRSKEGRCRWRVERARTVAVIVSRSRLGKAHEIDLAQRGALEERVDIGAKEDRVEVHHDEIITKPDGAGGEFHPEVP